MKIIVLYNSCNKNTSRFLKLESVRKLNKLKEQYPNIIFYRSLGKPNEDDILINNEYPTIDLDCQDNYENLPAKVVLGIKNIYSLHPDLDYLVKIDDDIEINLDTLLRNIKEYQHIDYGGFVIQAPYGRNETHHFGKCKDNKYNNTPVKLPHFTISIGGLYILSSKSVKIINESEVPYDKIVYEDVHIGILLEKNGIKPVHILATTENKDEYLNKIYIGWNNNDHQPYELFETF